MKARVKATGELINLPRLTRVYSYEEDETMFFLKDLEILDNMQPDYWTRLEHQYAGMAMQGLMSYIEQITPTKGRSYCDEIVDFSFNVAHALVEKYKKEEKK